jgi:hypothetical protein
VALFFEAFAGLGAGVIKLGSLPDDDRPGADDEDLHRGSILTDRKGESRGIFPWPKRKTR